MYPGNDIWDNLLRPRSCSGMILPLLLSSINPFSMDSISFTIRASGVMPVITCIAAVDTVLYPLTILKRAFIWIILNMCPYFLTYNALCLTGAPYKISECVSGYNTFLLSLLGPPTFGRILVSASIFVSAFLVLPKCLLLLWQ